MEGEMLTTTISPPPLPPLNATSLLNTCTLPPPSSTTTSQSFEKKKRLQQLQQWSQTSPSQFLSLLTNTDHYDKKTGCSCLHWAAGTGFDEALPLLLNFCNENDEDVINVKAIYPSTGRTPLHYAARNGHISTIKLLLSYKAHPNAKCSRGGVTPIQLAVWQNRLRVVKILVEAVGVEIVKEKNEFGCGLIHWIGMVPKKRWCGDDMDKDDEFIRPKEEQEEEEKKENENDASSNHITKNGDGSDGSGVLPLALHLHSLGLSYSSTLPTNAQNQGHYPIHKAAWGGNIPLLQYYRDEFGAHDTVQDYAGNYAADLARMGGHEHVRKWLQEECSGKRQKSLKILGLEENCVGMSEKEIRRRYLELAKEYHPDRCQKIKSTDMTTEEKEDRFNQIKEAFEHLTGELKGKGNQENPKHVHLQMLTTTSMTTSSTASDCTNKNEHVFSSENKKKENNDDLFQKRILAITSDFGNKGCPISAIPKRWNQVWPNSPFPSSEEYIVERFITVGRLSSSLSEEDEEVKDYMDDKVCVKKRVKLLPYLKWKCKGFVKFCKVDGTLLAFDRNKI